MKRPPAHVGKIALRPVLKNTDEKLVLASRPGDHLMFVN